MNCKSAKLRNQSSDFLLLLLTEHAQQPSARICYFKRWPLRPHLTLAQPPARIKIVGSVADCQSRFATLQHSVLTLARASAASAGSNPHGVYFHSSQAFAALPTSCSIVRSGVISRYAGQQRDWQVLVRQFRSLRASLLAHGNVGLLAIRASLWALDVTLHAQDYAECLKSLQSLVQHLFPALLKDSPPCPDLDSHTLSHEHGDKQVVLLGCTCALIANMNLPSVYLFGDLVHVGRHRLGQRGMDEICCIRTYTLGRHRSRHSRWRVTST